MRMTVTRALAELKLVDARINSTINGARLFDVYQKRSDRALMSGKPKVDFEKDAVSARDSIEALIERRRDIKIAVIKSNAVTPVTVGGKTMTVAEAIDGKASYSYVKSYADKVRGQLAEVKKTVEQNRVKLEQQVESMVTQNLGKERKADPSEYEAVSKPIFDANEFHLLDPAGLEKRIETIQSEMEEFLKDVDFALSEVNAKTEIEV